MQGRNLPLEVYVAVNKTMLGREPMRILSSPEKAQKYVDRFASKTGYFCHIEKSFIRGYFEPPNHVLPRIRVTAVKIFMPWKGIYSELSQAQRAAGREGTRPTGLHRYPPDGE